MKQPNPSDFIIETFNSGTSWFPRNAGIRITHIPTDITVEIDEGNSQHRNKALAFELLLEKLKRQTDWLNQQELFE